MTKIASGSAYRALVAVAFIFVIPNGLASASAQESLPDDANSVLAGQWALVSLYEENDAGEELDRWGIDPQGTLVADGRRFTFLLVAKDVIATPSTAPERACHALRSCRETMRHRVLGYAGTLAPDKIGSEVRFKVDEALESRFVGAEAAAFPKVEGDYLHLVSTLSTSPTGAFFAHLVWKRID